MNSNINLKNLLHRIWEVKQGINEIYDWVKHGLGADADFISDWADLKRVERDGTDADEIEGESLFDEVLQLVWKTGKDYIWHYRGQQFRITPFKNGTTADGGFIFYFGVKHSLISFSGIARDAVDTDTDLWDAIVARMHGIADGYASASKLVHVCAEMPAPDAEPVPDGTLACGDKPEKPAPAEPVVDQTVDDIDKDGYIKWKQSIESPQRYG